MTATDSFGELGLSIIGVGTQYPPYSLSCDSLEILAKKFYPDSPAMSKVLSINRFTGIEARSSIGTPDHPLVNQEKAPSISELNQIYFTDGVPLAVSAARKAIEEARIDVAQVTHIVSTTCTNSANPGFDHYVAKQLGITHQVEKVLLHGIGCSGGLAALRTGANLALGHAARRRPARVLCLALEVSTTMVRSELDSIHETQETRLGVALFSDCASAVVLSNGFGEPSEPVYDLLGWNHKIIPDTEGDLGFDVHPLGWKVVLSPEVPKIAQNAIAPSFTDLLASVPPLPATYRAPADFDWAMHPGGLTILTGAEEAMGLRPEHMRASYDTYMQHGNSSSATAFSVLDRLRAKDMDVVAPGGGPKELVVSCAFGPGVAVEMCLLRRNLGLRGISGLQTPPETESEAGRSEDGEALAAAAGGGDGGKGEGADKGEGPAPGAARDFVEEALEGLELD